MSKLEELASKELSPEALRKKDERTRNSAIKTCYSKLFSFMREHEDKIGSELIDKFVKSHTDFQKETITFVVNKY